MLDALTHSVKKLRNVSIRIGSCPSLGKPFRETVILSNHYRTKVLKNLTLITGGARSGKSDFAERLARAQNGKVLYLATMGFMSEDAEASERILRHKARRPLNWQTIEEPLQLPECVGALALDVNVCLIDCLSLWISNMLLADSSKDLALSSCEELVHKRVLSLLAAIEAKPSTVFIVVTNEVGSGIVPENKLARTFRDLLGIANQDIALAAGEVWLSCVGLQLRLKPAENLPRQTL
jgi:adenosylcobinamide kinase / adenosylcobinamide-phosphate guanylyltransferase